MSSDDEVVFCLACIACLYGVTYPPTPPLHIQRHADRVVAVKAMWHACALGGDDILGDMLASHEDGLSSLEETIIFLHGTQCNKRKTNAEG